MASLPNLNIYIYVVGDEHKKHSHHLPHLRWNVGPVSEQHFSTGPLRARYMFQLRDSQQVKISISPVDRKGAPAPVQSVSFSSSDDSVATVTQDPNNANEAMVVAQLPGACQIQVSADADLGDGVKPVTGTIDFTVIGGEAVALTVNAGTAEEQP